MDAETWSTLQEVLSKRSNAKGATPSTLGGSDVQARLHASRRGRGDAPSTSAAFTASVADKAMGPVDFVDSLPAFTSAAFVSRCTPLLHHVSVRALRPDGEQDEVMYSGTAADMRRTSCLEQGVCCNAHLPRSLFGKAPLGGGRAAAARAAAATAEAAYRSQHRGCTVLASQHLGFFAELNVTEIAARVGLGGASSASDAGSIIDDLRASLSRELRDLSRPSSPAAAASADAAAPEDRTVREAPPRSAREELDLLDAQCMLSILDGSKHAMLRAAADETPSSAAVLPASVRRLGSSRPDCMVAMATVSLFIDSEGRLINDAGSAADVPAADGAPVGDAAVTPDARGFVKDSSLRDALRPTLRTSFASLRELRLRKSTHWLDFCRPHAGNLLLVEALLHHGCPTLEPACGTGTRASSAASPFRACDTEAELSALVDSARAAKPLIDTRAYAGIAARLGPAAWEARRTPPSVHESRPMRLVVRRREAPSRKAGSEPNRPLPALAAQVIIAPLRCVAEGFAAVEPLADGILVLASVAVPMTQLGLTCTVSVIHAGRAAEASEEGALSIPVLVALEVTDAMGVTATVRSRRPAHVVVEGAVPDEAAGASIGGAATRILAHAGLDQLSSDTLSIRCIGRVPAAGPGGAHGTHLGGAQLGDVVVELSAIAMY